MPTALGAFFDDLARVLSGEPGLLVVALVVALAGFLWRVYVNRKRLAFKVEFNSKIGIVPPFTEGGDDEDSRMLKAFNTFSLLVVRLQNTGRVDITEDDYTQWPQVELRRDPANPTEEDRYIVDFRVTSAKRPTVAEAINKRIVEQWGVSGRVSAEHALHRPTLHRPTLRRRLARAMRTDFSGERGGRERELDGEATGAPGAHDDGMPIDPECRRRLTLNPPPVLKPGDEFDLVICLRSDNLHSREASPPKGHDVAVGLRGPSKVVDRNALPRRPSGTAIWAGVVVVLALVLAGTVLTSDAPTQCAPGELTVVGSSAFAPTLDRIGEGYREECTAATITQDAGGSLEGLRRIAGVGPEERGSMIAFSDGSARGETGDLERRPVAVLIFAVVVNRAAAVTELTSEQLRQIDSGAVTNWAQVGGANLPIRIIGRGSDSGTRQAYESYVLGRQEGPVSSNSCRDLDRVPPATGVAVRCERPSTEGLLAEVDATPGAIGYADAAPAAAYQNLVRLRLDGREPTGEFVALGYPFWTIEYAYTNGVPPGGELQDLFLGHLSDPAAAQVLNEDGYVPCVRADRTLAALCRQDR